MSTESHTIEAKDWNPEVGIEASADLTTPSKALAPKLWRVGEVEMCNKPAFAQRWDHSIRSVDHWIALGLPVLAIGKRRIRIPIQQADAWMMARFYTQRRKTPKTRVKKEEVAS